MISILVVDVGYRSGQTSQEVDGLRADGSVCSGCNGGTSGLQESGSLGLQGTAGRKGCSRAVLGLGSQEIRPPRRPQQILVAYGESYRTGPQNGLQCLPVAHLDGLNVFRGCQSGQDKVHGAVCHKLFKVFVF